MKTEPMANTPGKRSPSSNMLEPWRQIQRKANPAMQMAKEK